MSAPKCWRCKLRHREGEAEVLDPFVRDGIKICRQCAGERLGHPNLPARAA